MKYNKMKKSILSKMALIVLATMVTTSYTSHNEEKMESVSTTFISVENELSQFVDPSNKTPFNPFVISLTTKLQNLQRVIEATVRSHNDEISKEVDELLEYALEQFNILLDVFKRYNGKPDTQAVNFATEIKREFDVEKIFAEMINRLKILRGKAQQAGNKHLVKQIEELATKIQQKKKIWNAKSNLALVTGLVHRMKC